MASILVKSYTLFCPLASLRSRLNVTNSDLASIYSSSKKCMTTTTTTTTTDDGDDNRKSEGETSNDNDTRRSSTTTTPNINDHQFAKVFAQPIFPRQNKSCMAWQPTLETHSSLMINGVPYDKTPIVSVQASRNNTIITLAEANGNVIFSTSAVSLRFF